MTPQTLLPVARLAAATILVAALALAALSAVAAPTASAKPRSCLRGGATLVERSPTVVVVRVEARKTRGQTRHEKLLSCWVKTGKRATVADEADYGLDSRAYTSVEILGGRYVGVVQRNEGGVTESVSARVHDARARRLLHTTKVCDDTERGDLYGIDDVAFFTNGGMAFTCGSLQMYRSAKAQLEQLEPAGTDVRQIAVSRATRGFGERLFWAYVAEDGSTVTKSLEL